MQHIYSNDRLYELFFQLLDAGNPRDRLYVYRLENDKPVRPALYKGILFSDLEEFLRGRHRGGDFQVMIRRGEKMLLVGSIALGMPLNKR